MLVLPDKLVVKPVVVRSTYSFGHILKITDAICYDIFVLLKVWFNNKGYISVVSYMNVMNNLILRANLPGGEDPQKYGITVINHPVNRTKAQLASFTL